MDTKLTVSLCMSTYDRPEILSRVLESVVFQRHKFGLEIVVVDDGSPEPNALENRKVCQKYRVSKFFYISREPSYRNPSVARNIAFRSARGSVFICQSDDVLHRGNAMQALVDTLLLDEYNRHFVIAEVWNVDPQTNQPVACHGKWKQLTGPQDPHPEGPNPRRPLFFLGVVRRKDVWAVGGYDEEFTGPGRDDVWFADCLIHGAGVTPIYTSSAVGHHLHHSRDNQDPRAIKQSRALYRRKRLEAALTGRWVSSGGPWV